MACDHARVTTLMGNSARRRAQLCVIMAMCACQGRTFAAGCEATFIEDGQRNALGVGYSGTNAGEMAFHAQGWEPVFVADIDPQQKFDFEELLAGKVCSPLP